MISQIPDKDVGATCSPVKKPTLVQLFVWLLPTLGSSAVGVGKSCLLLLGH